MGDIIVQIAPPTQQIVTVDSPVTDVKIGDNQLAPGVLSLNGLNGVLNISGLSGINLLQSGQTFIFTNTGGSVAGVSSLNTLTNDVLISGFGGIYTSNNGQVIQISGNFLTGFNSGVYALQSNLLSTGQNLQGQINNIQLGTGNFITINDVGSSVVLNNLTGNILITGTGNVTVSTVGQQIIVSGILTDTSTLATKINLAFTGSSLYSLISSISGNTGNFITGVDLSSYATKTNLFNTGNALYSLISNISGNTGQFITGINLSSYALQSDLFLTGQNLQNQISSQISAINTSGFATVTYSNSTFATITNLSTSGANLQNQINNELLAINRSGFLTGIQVTGTTLPNLISVTGINLTQVSVSGSEIRITTSVDNSGFVTTTNLNASGFQTQNSINASGLATFAQLNNSGVFIESQILNLQFHSGDYYQNSNPNQYISQSTLNQSGFLSGIFISGIFVSNVVSFVGAGGTTVTTSGDGHTVIIATDLTNYVTKTLMDFSGFAIQSDLAATGASLQSQINTNSANISNLSNNTGNYVTYSRLDSSGLATQTYVKQSVDTSGFALQSAINLSGFETTTHASNTYQTISSVNNSGFALASNLSTTGANLLSQINTVSTNINISGFLTGIQITGITLSNLICVTGSNLTTVTSSGNQIKITSSVDSSGFFNQAKIDSSGFISQIALNNSGFETITAINNSGFVTLTTINTSGFLVSGQSGAFYPNSNPNNFISSGSINSSGFVSIPSSNRIFFSITGYNNSVTLSVPNINTNSVINIASFPSSGDAGGAIFYQTYVTGSGQLIISTDSTPGSTSGAFNGLATIIAL